MKSASNISHFGALYGRPRRKLSRPSDFEQETFVAAPISTSLLARHGKLDGRIALITGGTSGIGLATAKRLAQEAAYVFITGRTHSKLDRTVKEAGSRVTGVQGDVASLADLDRRSNRSKTIKVGLIVSLPTPSLHRKDNTAESSKTPGQIPFSPLQRTSS